MLFCRRTETTDDLYKLGGLGTGSAVASGYSTTNIFLDSK